MKLEFLNYDEIYNPDNLITSEEPLVKRKTFNDDGIYSEKIFGKNQDVNIDVLGWIFLGDDNYIISPIFYDRCRTVLSNKIFSLLISFEKKTDKNGELEEKVELKNVKVDENDINKGLIFFKENFIYLLEKYGNTSKPEYNVLKKAYEDGILFINKIPVFSPNLRPAMIEHHASDSKPVYSFDSINKKYGFILAYSNKMKAIDEYKIEKLDNDDDSDSLNTKMNLLRSCQDYAYQIDVQIIKDFLKGKNGLFRNAVISTRLNCTSRCVVVPSKPEDCKTKEIIIPYLSFLELYRFPLLNMIHRAEGKSYIEANEFFQECRVTFSEKMYKYMQELLKKTKGGLQVLLNRNP